MPVTNQWKLKAKDEKVEAFKTKSKSSQGSNDVDGDQTSAMNGPAKRGWGKKDDKSHDANQTTETKQEETPPVSRIKNIAGSFNAPQQEQQKISKRRIVVDETPDTEPLEDESDELDSEKQTTDKDEWKKQLEIEKGWAKNVASKFQSAPAEVVSKQPFELQKELGEEIILESQPVALEGVARYDDKTEDVFSQTGKIRSIAGQFKNQQSQPTETKPREKIVIDRSSGPLTLSENVPTEQNPDVVRATDQKNDFSVRAGSTRNIAERFLSGKTEKSDEEPKNDGSKPAWLLELENNKECGVYENEPTVREDVVRADDEQPDVISVHHSRNLRKMWNKIEKEEEQRKLQPKVIKPKEKPTPAPEPAPVETKPAEMKKQSIIGRKFTPRNAKAGDENNVANDVDKSAKITAPATKTSQQTPDQKDNKNFVKPSLKHIPLKK